uniref:Protein CUSTOS n=1 Tax=Oncorhynchus kisutch TaxID=8019 RepID=A0A8C7N9U5_ONCKI
MAEDSSSEDEDFKEAAWSFGTYGTHNANPAGKFGQTLVVAVSKHEHDGNELQTTPEFRAHVAKKLGILVVVLILFLGFEGFRLFTTSVPGEFTIDPPPPPVRRRPIPSSSDSDSEMEMRLREAAVSITHSLEDHNNSPVPKKNKKRKALQGECGEVEHCGESSPNAKSDEEQKRPEENILPLKKKKKKKKGTDEV